MSRVRVVGPFVGVTAAAMLVLAACGSGAGADSTTSSAPKSLGASALGAIVVQPVDVAVDYKPTVVSKSVAPTSPASFDYCGYHFASEANRTARERVAVKSQGGFDTGLSSEAIAYLNATDAAAALTELRAAVKGCDPKAYHETNWTKTPTKVTTTKVQFESDDPNYPVKNNVSDIMLLQTADHAAASVLTIYQQVGNVVVGTYFFQSGPAQVSQSSISTAVNIADITGRRAAFAVG